MLLFCRCFLPLYCFYLHLMCAGFMLGWFRVERHKEMSYFPKTTCAKVISLFMTGTARTSQRGGVVPKRRQVSSSLLHNNRKKLLKHVIKSQFRWMLNNQFVITRVETVIWMESINKHIIIIIRYNYPHTGVVKYSSRYICCRLCKSCRIPIIIIIKDSQNAWNALIMKTCILRTTLQ